VDTQQARDRVAWLDLLTVKEETLTLVGILVGGSIESGRFELKAEEEMYRGWVSESAKAAMRRITFGAAVKAKVRVTTMIHEEGAAEPTTSYYLDTIELRWFWTRAAAATNVTLTRAPLTAASSGFGHPGSDFLRLAAGYMTFRVIGPGLEHWRPGRLPTVCIW
jgi:hypothetical protein